MTLFPYALRITFSENVVGGPFHKLRACSINKPTIVFSQMTWLLSSDLPASALTVPGPSASVPSMPVHVIIDGYNLLGVRGQVGPGSSVDGEQVRDTLLQELTLYRQRKGHSITVVFDAWKERGGLEHREHRTGIQVVYTRGGEKADQVIQRMVRRYGRDCVVVSSDLEICHTAKDHGAFVLTSQEFQGKLKVAGAGRVTTADKAGLSVESSYGKDDEEPVQRRPDKKGNPRKLPKAQRKRNRQLRGF